jgi:hypothetical protein
LPPSGEYRENVLQILYQSYIGKLYTDFQCSITEILNLEAAAAAIASLSDWNNRRVQLGATFLFYYAGFNPMPPGLFCGLVCFHSNQYPWL